MEEGKIMKQELREEFKKTLKPLRYSRKKLIDMIYGDNVASMDIAEVAANQNNYFIMISKKNENDITKIKIVDLLEEIPDEIAEKMIRFGTLYSNYFNLTQQETDELEALDREITPMRI